MRFEITNGSIKSKAFRANGGIEVVKPGKTRTLDVQLTDQFIAQQTAQGVTFKPVGKKSASKGAEDAGGGKKDEPAKSIDEVLAMAGDPEVHHATFKAEAAKILGDDTPSKKDEIIAALEEAKAGA